MVCQSSDERRLRVGNERQPAGRLAHTRGNVVTPQPALDAILTRDEVAAWLKVKPRQVERLGVPCLDLGRKTKRYLTKDVLAWLEVQRRPVSTRVARGRRDPRSPGYEV
jgi:hypothetical protein